MFITADSLHLLNGYRPTEQQRAFHNAAENYLVVLAGAGMGSGKTSAMINQILIHLLRYPNSRGLLTREERESFSRTTLQTLLRWLPASQVKKHRSKAGEITFLNGSMLFYGAGLTGTRGLARAKGLEISVLGIDQAEEVSEQAFDLLAGTRVRTADPKVHLSVLLTANPSPCWLRTRYVRHVSANAKYIPMLTEQNPHVDPNYLKRMEEILPTERYNQYARGDWDAVDAINAIFRLEDIEAAMSRKVERGTPVKLSCDVSRAGKSATVIAIQYGNKFLR